MSSRYYEPGSARANKVHELFSSIAARYDLINDVQSFLLHRAWKRRLLRLAAPVPGETALDLCCGTGDVTFALASAGARSIGLDFCQPMLDVALRRARQTPTAQLAFVQSDAQRLPFPDKAFDVVTISYGLRNLSDWKAGAKEMFRVLKDRGRLVILDFSQPRNRLWRGLYLSYLRLALPVLGWVLCGDAQAYAYVLESLRHFPDPTTIADFLVELGGQEVQAVPLLGGVMGLVLARRA